MKLAAFAHPDTHQNAVAVVDGQQLLPLSGVGRLAELFAAVSADAGDDFGTALTRHVEALPRDAALALDAVRLLPPVFPAVRDYWCVGLNYLAHAKEGQEVKTAAVPQELPEYPTWFTKATGAANGPFDAVPLHAGTTRRLDFEAELAVVIGRGGVDISEETALSHVAGYCCGNDISARELQRRHGGQWVKGKSLDGTCPTGPWLVTPDEIGDPQALTIACRVNGETLQSSNTGQMIFSVAKLIADLSQGMTLLPGDVILTGTPEGVGFARKPPRYLGAGDVVETELERIGTLRNPISG